MIILPIFNFVLPLMITCLVLVDDPPRCSECRKKMEMNVAYKKTNDFDNLVSKDEINKNALLYKYFKK
ncbi:MAG: hypothetical protein CL935_04325 [Deltaproteobacteria bacterium]|nr:hypothetical protein [Deltaproteobacteria bacterium]|tara:strand:+ start:759 stop:962 length:204 start_codon:yes stop_codon:yes gene_type:complete